MFDITTTNNTTTTTTTDHVWVWITNAVRFLCLGGAPEAAAHGVGDEWHHILRQGYEGKNEPSNAQSQATALMIP